MPVLSANQLMQTLKEVSVQNIFKVVVMVFLKIFIVNYCVKWIIRKHRLLLVVLLLLLLLIIIIVIVNKHLQDVNTDYTLKTAS